MMIFRLTPINVKTEHWEKGSKHKGEIIVRAEHEDMARQHAHDSFRIARNVIPGKDSPEPVWKSHDLADCRQLDDWKHETDGPPEILYPIPSYYEVLDPRRETMILRAQAYLADHEPMDVQEICNVIYNHLQSGQEDMAKAIERTEVGARIKDWVEKAKETGNAEQLHQIADGLCQIADELERQPMHTH